MIMSQVLLLPLRVLFAWGCVALGPRGVRCVPLKLYDGAVVASAALISRAAAWLVVDSEPLAAGSIWATVSATLSTFHVFPGVLLPGGCLRRRVFQPGSGRCASIPAFTTGTCPTFRDWPSPRD